MRKILNLQARIQIALTNIAVDDDSVNKLFYPINSLTVNHFVKRR